MSIVHFVTGGFSPLKVPNCSIWLEADRGITLDGSDNVSAWADASGNGKNAAQSSAAIRPAYVTNIFNGHPVVRFAALPTYLTIGPVGFARNAAGYTLFFVYKTTSVATLLQILLDVEIAGGSLRIRFMGSNSATGRSTGGGLRLDSDSIQNPLNQGTFNPANLSIHCLEFDYANAAASMWINGTNYINAAAFQTAGNTSDTDASSVTLGCSQARILERNFIGDVALVLGYRTKLTMAQRGYIQKAYGAKYGITVA